MGILFLLTLNSELCYLMKNGHSFCQNIQIKRLTLNFFAKLSREQWSPVTHFLPLLPHLRGAESGGVGQVGTDGKTKGELQKLTLDSRNLHTT